MYLATDGGFVRISWVLCLQRYGFIWKQFISSHISPNNWYDGCFMDLKTSAYYTLQSIFFSKGLLSPTTYFLCSVSCSALQRCRHFEMYKYWILFYYIIHFNHTNPPSLFHTNITQNSPPSTFVLV